MLNLNLDTLSASPTSTAADRARRADARQRGLDIAADGHVRTEDELEASFADALSAVTLTGDAYDDRCTLTRAANAYARTVTGWTSDFLADVAERAIEDALRTFVPAAMAA